MSRPPPEVSVSFSVDDDVNARWDEPRIAELVRTIVARERAVGAFTIAVHLVSEETIRAMNAEHRARDSVTDVLSFPLVDDAAFVLPPGEAINLGDVVVSYARAVEQAHEYGHSEVRELAYLVA